MHTGFSWVVGGGWLAVFAGMAAATSVLRTVIVRRQKAAVRADVQQRTQQALLASLLRRATVSDPSRPDHAGLMSGEPSSLRTPGDSSPGVR